MSRWTNFRDNVIAGAVAVGNYYVPGSSILTKRLASKGGQAKLNTRLGIAAQVIGAGVGMGYGSEITGIKASSTGAWMRSGIETVGGKVWDSGGKVATGLAAVVGATKPSVALTGLGAPQGEMSGQAAYDTGGAYYDYAPVEAAPQQAGGQQGAGSYLPLLLGLGLAVAAKVIK